MLSPYSPAFHIAGSKTLKDLIWNFHINLATKSEMVLSIWLFLKFVGLLWAFKNVK